MIMVKDKKSYFNMWRTLVALTTIDGIVTTEEKDWVKDYLDTSLLDDEEKKVLISDLVDHKDPESFLSLITETSHLAQLHHLANLIFHSDTLDYKERVYLEKISKYISSKVDHLNATRKSADYLNAAQLKTRDEKSKVRGLFLALVELYRG